MTKIIYISGVHGVGKTTVLDFVAGKLEACGNSVYVFPEMSYKPMIKIGTVEFQIWFKKQIIAREPMIDALMAENTFDYILLDRHLYDVDIYTARILGELDIEIDLERGRKYFLLTASKVTLEMRLNSRNDEFRDEWNENDLQYLDDIRGMFELIINDYNKSLYTKPKITVIDTTALSAEAVANKIMEMLY